MDVLGLMRALGALAVVLAGLAGALWAVRRFDIRLPGRVEGAPDRRLELVERLGIDQRRSAVLIRRDGREHLVIISPEGHVLVETLDRPAQAGVQAAGRRASGDASGPPAQTFADLLNRELGGRTAAGRRRLARASNRKH